MTRETWRPVVGWEGRYEVSDLGRVRSLSRIVTFGIRMRPSPGRILRPSMRAGYLAVCLSRGGEKVTAYVHKLVLLAFVGPAPTGMQACHGVAGPLDNSIENIRWDTQKSNMDDRRMHGTLAVGERHGRAKFTDAQVADLKARLNAPHNVSGIAREFGVSRSVIHKIKSGKTWRHVEAP